MMKRIALWLGVGLLVTACAGAPKSGATSAPAEAASQPTPPVIAGPAGGDPARLIPVQSEALGVSFAYPEQEPRPEVEEVGGAMMSLTVRFSTWEFVVVRKEPAPGKDLAALAKEHMDANTQASRGRIVSTDLGEQTLGGVPARAVSSYFDSAAGRRDGLFYIVLKGPYQYGISCGTKQGPPVVPWESVRPLCEQALATVSFDAPVEPLVRLNDGQVRLPEGIVGTIPGGLNAAGLTILLDGVNQETASITFAECPAKAPDSGCVGNHRSWLELHPVVTLPSGRKVDNIGQALDGSGAAPRLRATYAELLESLRLEKQAYANGHAVQPMSGRSGEVAAVARVDTGRLRRLLQVRGGLSPPSHLSPVCYIGLWERSCYSHDPPPLHTKHLRKLAQREDLDGPPAAPTYKRGWRQSCGRVRSGVEEHRGVSSPSLRQQG